jgi:hypothetical protein
LRIFCLREFLHFVSIQVRCAFEGTGYAHFTAQLGTRPGAVYRNHLRPPFFRALFSPTIDSVAQTISNPQARLPIDTPSASERLLNAPIPIRLWHLASLDAPTVAVVWSLAFAWAAGIRLPAWVPLVLALAAWAVYIADRLLDTRTAFSIANFDGLRERHLFHHRHRQVLLPMALAAACACAWIALTQMTSISRERNTVLAIAALAYFTGVHSSRRLTRLRLSALLKKELLVGVLFCAACALPAFTRAAIPVRGPLLAVAVYFALLAWINCHAIDRWEARDCSKGTQIVKPAIGLACAALPLAALLKSTQPRFAALVLAGAAAALLLALFDRSRARLTPIALRAAADLAMLTPLALLLK